MMTCENDYGILNEIKELGLDYMEHDYMHIKSVERGYGFSRNLNVVVDSYMVLFGIVEIIRGIFMLLGLVYFHIHSLMWIYGRIYNTEH